MANKIAVLGSINIDTTYRVNEFPKPGQTIQALSKSSTGGGKGNNQAVAAARSEAQTYFIGMVGTDDGQIYARKFSRGGNQYWFNRPK